MSEKYVAAAGRYSEEEKLYRRCGKSGLKLPKVSLGLWHNFGTEADMDVMKSMLFTAFAIFTARLRFFKSTDCIPVTSENIIDLIYKLILLAPEYHMLCRLAAAYTDI